jgi:membrane-associated phospholipid phosphatase
LITAAASIAALLWWTRRIERGEAAALDARAIEVLGARERDGEGVSSFATPRAVFAEALLIAAIPALRSPERWAILGAPLAVSVGGTLLKRWIPRERPTKHRFAPRGGESFPSTHTAHVAALLLVASYIARAHGVRGGTVLVALVTSLVAVERVRGAWHWPSDVVGGALLGFASAHVARVAARM